MKTSFPFSENQPSADLRPRRRSTDRRQSGPAHPNSPTGQNDRVLTNRGKHENLLVKYENVILANEEEQMRLTPLSESQWDDEAVQRALAQMLPEQRRNSRDAGNALAMLVHHPKLARVFLRFNVELLYRSTLPGNLRELAILRVAHRRGCEYEWVHHITFGKEAGLTDSDIEDLQHGAGRDELHQAVLNAADELDEASRLSPATEAVLTQHLDEHQLMELVFTVGCYSMLAMAFNTFGVELDEEPESGR